MIIAILIVINIILIYIVYCGYKYYIAPPDYQPINYNDIQFKTGDIILSKAFHTYIPFGVNSDFTHVGLIIVINKIPYLLEMLMPFPYLTPLSHKLTENDGKLLFYKKLKTILNSEQLKLLEGYITKSESMLYRKFPYKSNTESFSNELVCTEFVFHALHEAKIVDKAKYDGTVLLNYIRDLEEYEPVKYLKFSPATRRYNPFGISKILISGINIEAYKEELLQMPMHNGIWRSKIQKCYM
jgi:hypothetical protein